MNSSKTIFPTFSFGKMFLRGIFTFGILLVFDMITLKKVTDAIIAPYTTKRANFLFFGPKTYEILNSELQRRGIDYSFKWKGFNTSAAYGKSVKALNLIIEDYNNRGC